jgi:hypothetical protein
MKSVLESLRVIKIRVCNETKSLSPLMRENQDCKAKVILFHSIPLKPAQVQTTNSAARVFTQCLKQQGAFYGFKAPTILVISSYKVTLKNAHAMVKSMARRSSATMFYMENPVTACVDFSTQVANYFFSPRVPIPGHRPRLLGLVPVHPFQI